jgi:hypothetical protein
MAEGRDRQEYYGQEYFRRREQLAAIFLSVIFLSVSYFLAVIQFPDGETTALAGIC